MIENTSNDTYPRYVVAESIYNPTDQDKQLYENYGSYPLENDVLSMELPPFRELIESCFSSTPDFFKRCTSILTPNYPKSKIKNIYLRIQYDDPKRKLTHIRDFIHTVRFIICGKQVQSYTGNFLDLNHSLENRFITIEENSTDIWIPIPMTFHQYEAFPFYYLENHEVKVIVDFADKPNVGTKRIHRAHPADSHGHIRKHHKQPRMKYASLYIEYEMPNPILIDKLVLSPILYLWEEVQCIGIEEISRGSKIQLNFTKPIKTLIWTIYFSDVKGNRWYSQEPILAQAKIQINNTDLTMMLPATYFNSIMGAKFTETPREITDPNLYCYTFAEKPTWIRPTGTLDFSDLTAVLMLQLDNLVCEKVPKDMTPKCEIYALSYNIMEIDHKRGISFLFEDN